jgi:antitoxin YefM
MSTITLPVTEAKQRFTELVKNAEESFDRYLVTKNGKDAAVLLSAEEYENLLETLDILANKKEILAIAEGDSQAKRGETISLSKYLASRGNKHKGNSKR